MQQRGHRAACVLRFVKRMVRPSNDVLDVMVGRRDGRDTDAHVTTRSRPSNGTGLPEIIVLRRK
jgi:hypothetical protein